jgi:benzoyl-CoA reductase/2-hydroxyglutaryl-CoA dehydratase subunit BcrC/BadD/HgdB
MSGCCDRGDVSERAPCDSATDAFGQEAEYPLTWFAEMIPHCLEYARAAKAEGRPVVGITCEYTPRELIMAAGAVPVCLCGGSAETIPAAERDLPTNLCPLIKSTYGYHVQKGNPFLEMADLVVVETTCDGKKKMYELLAESRPVHVIELPQKAKDADAMAHWVRELKTLKGELERQLGVKITRKKIRAAIEVMNRERRLRRELAGLMKVDSPPLTGRELLDLKSIISGIPADLEQYGRALEVLPGRESAADISSRVRVLMTGVPIVHGAERVAEIVEDNGGLVVCMENCTGLKPILDDVEEAAGDPMQAVAEKYFGLHCSVMTKNERRLEALRELAGEYRPECVIELIWQACLTYDVESYFVKRLAEEELGIPYMRIETDYSPSDTARITTRVEALFETVRGKAGRGLGPG